MKCRIITLLLAVIAAALALTPAAMAAQGDLVFRTRAIYIAPDDSHSDGAVPGLDLEVAGDAAVDVDLSYFVSDNLALELTALVSSHEVDSAIGPLGSVRLLPPVLTLQYHFLPEAKVRPYLGAGLNYTIFYNESGLLDTLGVEFDDAFHFAAQAGADLMLSDSLSLNLDLKYVDLETEVDSNLGDLGDLEIAPWIFGIGLGYHF